MIKDWRFIRALILVGFLVLLSLNVVAQGPGKMSPDGSLGFLELSLDNQVITITAIGEPYSFDTGGVLDTLGYLKNRSFQLADHCQRNTIFWGKRIINEGSGYFLRFMTPE